MSREPHTKKEDLLRELLRLKRYEQPDDCYYSRLPDRIIARIREQEAHSFLRMPDFLLRWLGWALAGCAIVALSGLWLVKRNGEIASADQAIFSSPASNTGSVAAISSEGQSPIDTHIWQPRPSHDGVSEAPITVTTTAVVASPTMDYLTVGFPDLLFPQGVEWDDVLSGTVGHAVSHRFQPELVEMPVLAPFERPEPWNASRSNRMRIEPVSYR